MPCQPRHNRQPHNRDAGPAAAAPAAIVRRRGNDAFTRGCTAVEQPDRPAVAGVFGAGLRGTRRLLPLVAGFCDWAAVQAAASAVV
jgi:transposase